MPDTWAPCSFRAHRRLHPVHNTRVVGIFDGQLYTSAASGTFVNFFTVGSGLPTTSGQVATSLPGMPTATGPSPYAFALFDRDATVPGVDTLYVADDRSPPTGGVQKWTFDGSTAGNYLQCRAIHGHSGAHRFHGVALAPQ